MNRTALQALIVVQVVFGLWPIAAKLAFLEFSPMAIAAIRAIGGALILFPIAQRIAKRKLDVSKDGYMMVALALLGVVVNQGLFIVGLQKTTAINATLIITVIPVFTYLFAVLAGREQLGPRRLLGIVLAMSGVALIIGAGGVRFGFDSVVGDILVFLNCVSFSAYLVLGKPLAERVSPLSLIAWQFVVAAAVFAPLGFLDGMVPQAQAASTTGWAIVAFIILGPTVLTYLLNTTALRDVPSSTVAVFIYIQPVLTTILAWWLLDEPVSWTLLPGAVMVFAGVAVVAWRSAVKQKEREGEKETLAA